MKSIQLLVFLLIAFSAFNQTPSIVDYPSYLQLVKEVEPHRAERLISTDEFSKLQKEENVIVLDTRSKAMYEAKHIKGAIHINFSDFTQEVLELLIPDKNTKILIYCNNNFEDDQKYFATKAYIPKDPVKEKPITLALNIPTYINLYGYGYKNVYELGELISIYDQRIPLEGTAVTFSFK